MSNSNDRMPIVLCIFIGVFIAFWLGIGIVYLNNYVLAPWTWECTEAAIPNGTAECIEYKIKGDEE